MPVDPIRQICAVDLGTGILVATVVGSGIMAERLTDDVALQLLGNTLPTGAILVVLITALGPLSGANGMFKETLLHTSKTIRTGSAQWLAEIVATFGLVFFVLADLKTRPSAIPWIVGLYIAAAYWFTAFTSFANPAVALGRAFTDTFSGIRPLDLPGFVISQLIGAAIAVFLAGWLYRTVGSGRQS